MSLETESILDRRRLRRKLGWWRSIAIVLGVLALAVAAVFSDGSKELLKKAQIARIKVTGLITEDRKQLEMLRRLANASHVKGVLVFVNSPGGTTTGAEALYNEIRALAKTKPVVAQFGTVAASAAYITGLATDHIVARSNTITGSVGVIMQWPEFTGLFEKIGVKMNEIKSGPLKAAPSPFQPVTPEARQVTEEMIAEGQRWFVGLVQERRKIEPSSVPGLTQGRVYLGRSAVRYKLVDAIGGERAAVDWMVKKRNVEQGLKVIDWEPEQDLGWPLTGAIGSYLADILRGTVVNLGQAATSSDQLGRLGLDGLVSIWHPGKN